MKTKGARLTTEISLPGRFVVYVPHGDGLGVSRRLEDEERNRLKAILKEIAPKKGGVIVRTAAEGASAEDIERDLDFLQRLWKSIEAQAKDAKAPSLIYQEAELPLRVVRDLFTGDFERLLVDHDRTHKRIVGYLKKTSPHMAERVTRYKEREPLMEAFGVEQEIKSTLNRRVDLPSGGYLIFDYAEAFTVIDVNTGRFVGSRSKKSGARLEDTITKNNLEAVKEVVRQLRLRDIGGIIVIDFIDMASPKNRAAVEEALGEELERDRTKTYVVEISPLGLVEMTRQNVTDGPREVMTKKCPTCGGDGIVVSEHTAAVDVERRLRSLVTPGSRSKAFKVEVEAKVASLVAGPAARGCASSRRRPSAASSSSARTASTSITSGCSTRARSRRSRRSCRSRSARSSSVKLGEVGLHDAHAGVGKVEDVDVVVGDAAKLVGKKVKVRITAVTEGMAWAELLSPVAPTRRAADGRARGREADPREAARRRARRTRPRARRREDDDGARRRRADESSSTTDRRRGSRGARRRGGPTHRRRDGGRTGDAAEEAHAPRHPRRPQPQEEAGVGRAVRAHGRDAATGEPGVGEAVETSSRRRPRTSRGTGPVEARPGRAGHPRAGAASSARPTSEDGDAHGAPEEAHAPRLARRQEPPQEAGSSRARPAATERLEPDEPDARAEPEARLEPDPELVRRGRRTRARGPSSRSSPSRSGARGRRPSAARAATASWGYTPMTEWGDRRASSGVPLHLRPLPAGDPRPRSLPRLWITQSSVLAASSTASARARRSSWTALQDRRGQDASRPTSCSATTASR